MKEFISAFLQLVLYICVSGLISNFVGFLIRRDRINADAFPYISFKWEKNGEIYRALGVQKWKNKVPDMSKYLKKLLYPKTMGLRPSLFQVERLIKESCVAECIHTMLIAASPLISYFIDGPYGELLTLLYALGNVPFIIIQRYNRPQLKSLYAQLLERKHIKQASEGRKNESPDIVM